MLPQLHSKNWKKLTMTAIAQPNAVILLRQDDLFLKPYYDYFYLR